MCQQNHIEKIKPNNQFELYIIKEVVVSDSGYQGWEKERVLRSMPIM